MFLSDILLTTHPAYFSDCTRILEKLVNVNNSWHFRDFCGILDTLITIVLDISVPAVVFLTFPPRKVSPPALTRPCKTDHKPGHVWCRYLLQHTAPLHIIRFKTFQSWLTKLVDFMNLSDPPWILHCYIRYKSWRTFQNQQIIDGQILLHLCKENNAEQETFNWTF